VTPSAIAQSFKKSGLCKGYKCKIIQEKKYGEEFDTWKKYKNTEYYVSNCGKIKKGMTGHILKTNIKGNREYCCIDGKNMLVHRIVAETFLENPNNYPQVDHIDKNSLNNNVSNLRWITGYENIIHSMAKVVMQYDLNDNFIKEWRCIKEAAKVIERDYKGIIKCCQNGQKTCGGFIWKYKV
jgi:hypothetical protein